MVHTAPWPHYPNRNVFSDRRNPLYNKSTSPRCDDKLFHSPGPSWNCNYNWRWQEIHIHSVLNKAVCVTYGVISNNEKNVAEDYLVQIFAIVHQILCMDSHLQTWISDHPCCPTPTAQTSWCRAHWRFLLMSKINAPICWLIKRLVLSVTKHSIYLLIRQQMNH